MGAKISKKTFISKRVDKESEVTWLAIDKKTKISIKLLQRLAIVFLILYISSIKHSMEHAAERKFQLTKYIQSLIIDVGVLLYALLWNNFLGGIGAKSIS